MRACKAADLASQSCSTEHTRFIRSLQVNHVVQEEVNAAASGILETREALADEKNARDEMEEAIALIEFDPAMSELETT